MNMMGPESGPLRPHLWHEEALWANGALWVAGIDEAGRGALAGPVAAAAVILPQIRNFARELDGVRDSKLMTPEQRQEWAKVVQARAVSWAIGMASAREIDALGILPATRLAAERALQGLAVHPDHLLVDYICLPQVLLPQTALVKGDRISLSIAAASVLAKTSRDALLQEYDQCYPGYGFAEHKGYGTSAHRAAIEMLGPCPIHRLSFAPFVIDG